MESKSPDKIGPFYFTLVLIASSFLSLLVVFCQNYNIDEGNILYASQMLFKGLIPYQDFFFDKLPLLLISYGLPQTIFPPGLFTGRLTATAFFLGTVVLIMLIGKKIGGRKVGIIAGAFYGLKITYIVGNNMAFSYAPAIFFFCFSLYFFFDNSNRHRWLLTVLFWSLATQIRQIYLTSMLFLFLVEYKKSDRSFFKLLAETIFVTIISSLYLIPFFYGNNNVFHDLFITYLSPSHLHGLPFWTVKIHWFKGTINEYYPELIIGFFLFIHHLFTAKKILRYPHTLLGAMIIYLIFTSFKSYYAYSIHNLITAPMIALLIGLAINNMGKQFPKRSIAVIILVTFLLVQQGYPHVKRHLLVGSKFYSNVKYLSSEIATRTTSDDQILSFNNILLVESNRKSISGMSFSVISLYTTYDDEKCKKYHLTNPNLLLEIVEKRQVEMIEISNRMSRILQNMLGPEWIAQFSSAIQKNYQLVLKSPDVYERDGNYFLFQLKPSGEKITHENFLKNFEDKSLTYLR